MNLPPLNIDTNNSLSIGLYNALKSAIDHGQLKPGDKLTETMIAKHANISRTPVREALRRMLNEGILEHSGRSLIVTQMNIEALSELCVVRVKLEGLAARLAAERRSESDIIALETFIDMLEEAIQQDNFKDVVSNNHAFHFFIWEAAANNYLKNQLSTLRDTIVRLQASTLHSKKRQEDTLKEHKTIVEAIKNGDALLAERLTEEHFRKAEAIRLTKIRMQTIQNSITSP